MEIVKPHAHLHITEKKSTKFQMNLMKEVGGGSYGDKILEGKSLSLRGNGRTKFKSAWASTPITLFEIVKSEI